MKTSPMAASRLGKAGTSAVPLRLLAKDDQVLLLGVYRSLAELFVSLEDAGTTSSRKWQQLIRMSKPTALDHLLHDLSDLGEASRPQDFDGTIARAMHAVRGGALSAFLGRLQLLDCLAMDDKELQTLSTLLRDHLGVMREAVTGLFLRAPAGLPVG